MSSHTFYIHIKFLIVLVDASVVGPMFMESSGRVELKID